MKLLVVIDDYKIESCKRKVQEKYSSWYDEVIANGTPIVERTGIWIITSNGRLKCSNCKNILKENKATPFCPYCGSIMEEE